MTHALKTQTADFKYTMTMLRTIRNRADCFEINASGEESTTLFNHVAFKKLMWELEDNHDFYGPNTQIKISLMRIENTTPSGHTETCVKCIVEFANYNTVFLEEGLW